MSTLQHDAPHNRPTSQRWPGIVLFLLCTVAFAFMEAIAISEWLAGVWHLADVGNIQYCLVNTWHGQFMHSPMVDANHFALHFTPIFILLMPLVWLSSYPIPLVTSYQLALALTPVPIYLLARQRGLPPWPALAAGAWFIGNHFVGSLELSNHFESFYVLFALATMAAMRGTRSWPFWLFAVLAITVKEDCAAWLLAYAIWEWVFNREDQIIRRRALRLGVLCIAYGIVALGTIVILSQFKSVNASSYVSRMGGISIGADTAGLLLILVATSGGFCLVNWRASLLLLVCLPVILGNFFFTRNLLYYYSYPVLPCLAFATVSGAAVLYRFFLNKNISGRAATCGISAALLLVGLVQLPMVTRTNDLVRWVHQPTGRDAMRREIATHKLPKEAPLAIQYNLWGVVPWRWNTAYLNKDQLRDDQYVFADLRGPNGLPPNEYAEIMGRLSSEVDSGQRKELYHAYDFLILSPVTDRETSQTTETRL